MKWVVAIIHLTKIIAENLNLLLFFCDKNWKNPHHTIVSQII